MGDGALRRAFVAVYVSPSLASYSRLQELYNGLEDEYIRLLEEDAGDPRLGLILEERIETLDRMQKVAAKILKHQGKLSTY